MNDVLLDSDILIDFSKKDPFVTERLEELQKASACYLSIISYMELLIGARNKEESRIITSFLERGGFGIIHINLTISYKAVDLIKSFALSHGLKIPDALIAATALDENLSIYTRNLKHFCHIPNLKILN